MSLELTAQALIAAALGGVLGWTFLAGWSRRNILHAHVSPRALKVGSAVTTAIAWGIVVLRMGAVPALPAVLAFTAAGTVLAVVDLAEKRLPNRVIALSFVVVALLLVVASGFTGEWIPLVWALAGSAGMFAVYFVLALISPSSMGMGDVKLALVIGLLLGWFGLNVWLVGLLAAFLLGGLVAIVALLLRRVTLRGSIPFGPSMLAGALIALLVAGP